MNRSWWPRARWIADQLEQKKLLYIGRRTINRLGCSGCHDIPGYEDAKPIGTGLADWGRKETSKLAFEQIIPYLEADLGQRAPGRRNACSRHPQASEHPHALDVKNMDPDTGFYVEKLLGHEREGFIWQKIREPRSYDYKKTETKDYTDRLRMPKFNITDAQREAVITFVLGLVSRAADGPLHLSKPRRGAKPSSKASNCWPSTTAPAATPCRWSSGPSTTSRTTPTTKRRFNRRRRWPTTRSCCRISRRKNWRPRRKPTVAGWAHALLVGMPNPEVAEDDEGRPLHYFGLWKNEAIDGHAWLAGGQEVPITRVADHRTRSRRWAASWPGLIHPVVLEREKKTNPNAKASDAWGWVPPPWWAKVARCRPQWVHDFLLDPYPDPAGRRVADAEVQHVQRRSQPLANYFAAMDSAQYPLCVRSADAARVPRPRRTTAIRIGWKML